MPTAARERELYERMVAMSDQQLVAYTAEMSANFQKVQDDLEGFITPEKFRSPEHIAMSEQSQELYYIVGMARAMKKYRNLS